MHLQKSWYYKINSTQEMVRFAGKIWPHYSFTAVITTGTDVLNSLPTISTILYFLHCHPSIYVIYHLWDPTHKKCYGQEQHEPGERSFFSRGPVDQVSPAIASHQHVVIILRIFFCAQSSRNGYVHEDYYNTQKYPCGEKITLI